MALEEILFSSSSNSEHLKTNSEKDEKGGFQNEKIQGHWLNLRFPNCVEVPWLPQLIHEGFEGYFTFFGKLSNIY